jgi:hypothetical protein
MPAFRLLLVFACLCLSACSDRKEVLQCTGSLSFGERTWDDAVTLKVTDFDVFISGVKGTDESFDGELPYKICNESDDEISFEYSSIHECNADASRFGTLRKSSGSLMLSRTDQNQPFDGDYKCPPMKKTSN